LQEGRQPGETAACRRARGPWRGTFTRVAAPPAARRHKAQGERGGSWLKPSLSPSASSLAVVRFAAQEATVGAAGIDEPPAIPTGSGVRAGD
jgi:hypothetical protein